MIVSEQAFGVGPRPGLFPVRNRIIAALADVVVVVEATIRGGARITAQYGLEYGRPVLAVPGSRRNPAAAGTNALIADGAHPLVDWSDVALALGMTPGDAPGRRRSSVGRHRAPQAEHCSMRWAVKPRTPISSASRDLTRARGGRDRRSPSSSAPVGSSEHRVPCGRVNRRGTRALAPGSPPWARPHRAPSGPRSTARGAGRARALDLVPGRLVPAGDVAVGLPAGSGAGRGHCTRTGSSGTRRRAPRLSHARSRDSGFLATLSRITERPAPAARPRASSAGSPRWFQESRSAVTPSRQSDASMRSFAKTAPWVQRAGQAVGERALAGRREPTEHDERERRSHGYSPVKCGSRLLQRHASHRLRGVRRGERELLRHVFELDALRPSTPRTTGSTASW